MANGYVSEIFASFQGEGLFAGRRHLFLRMAGCNLRCRYCDTPESLERTANCTVYGLDGSARAVPNPLEAKVLSSLLEPYLASPGLHALAVTGGEPLVQSSFLAELFRTARPPLPILLETNGTYPERLAALLPFVDIVSMDLKLSSNSGEAPLWDEHRKFLASSLGKTLYVKVPVDATTLDEEVREAARLVAAADRGVAFFLQPIFSPGSVMQISAARLEHFYDIASAELVDVRVLPQTHRLLGVR
ncbi:MAG TPA: 7-carboxy-7-deazaguanine synthase QueE [Candidatus Binatia bacterium]|nr:7-carboxy-7-deazaguanine synthase QueE [Candidatus Binatia bacterium]